MIVRRVVVFCMKFGCRVSSEVGKRFGCCIVKIWVMVMEIMFFRIVRGICIGVNLSRILLKMVVGVVMLFRVVVNIVVFVM